MDKEVIREIGEALMQINELLKQGLPPLKARVDHIIKHKVTDYNQIDRLLSDLLDYTQIDEGLTIYRRLCKYSFYIYPDLTASYIETYREMYDPNTPCDDGE
jgi:signal transduction histidine kinase